MATRKLQKPSHRFTIDRDLALEVVTTELKRTFADRVALRIAQRIISLLEPQPLPPPIPPPTEEERARAREIARRAGLRVRKPRK